MHELCKGRLKKVAELEALGGRRDYLLQLIAATRHEIRTNTNRLHALCSSALFYWGHLPAQLTPMIRPLIESTDTENLERLAEESFFDSFPIMLAATRQRQPCPHPKILKQLANGVQQVSGSKGIRFFVVSLGRKVHSEAVDFCTRSPTLDFRLHRPATSDPHHSKYSLESDGNTREELPADRAEAGRTVGTGAN